MSIKSINTYLIISFIFLFITNNDIYRNSAFADELFITYKKDSENILTYNASEFFNLLNDPYIPSKKEFETSKEYETRKEKVLSESETIKNGQFIIHIPINLVTIGKYDMVKKRFPVTIDRYRWKYKRTPIDRRSDTTLWSFEIGVILFNGYPTKSLYLYVPENEAKEIRSRENQCRLQFKATNVSVKKHIYKLNRFRETYNSIDQWEHYKFDQLIGEHEDEVGDGDRVHYFADVEVDLETLDFVDRKGTNEYDFFELILGNKRWTLKLWFMGL